MIQWPGEDAWHAIVNSYALDIVEEDQFLLFCERLRVDYDNLDALEAAYKRWRDAQPND